MTNQNANLLPSAPMTERFTIVFEGDIRKFVGNPLKTETPFGTPYTVAVGDIIEQFNDLQGSSKEAPGRAGLPYDQLLKLLVTACTHARRDMQVIIPIVESGAGMSASSLRNTLGLINKALVAAQPAKGQEKLGC